jgi:hypothetical protein
MLCQKITVVYFDDQNKLFINVYELVLFSSNFCGL